MKTIAEQLNHDFDKGALELYDFNNNLIYCEDADGYWIKREYDTRNNLIHYECSNGFWGKRKYDSNNKEIYSECSDAIIRHNRTKQII